jgi:Domain of unknown function (DUF3479)
VLLLSVHTGACLQVAKALMAAAQARDPAAWMRFQSTVHDLKLKRNAVQRRLAALSDAPPPAAAAPSDAAAPPLTGRTLGRVCFVLITGFESFNQALYRRAAAAAREKAPALDLCVFSDRDIDTKRGEIEAALDGADVFFGSLIFDFDQVEWLKEKVADVPLRLVFESALELMSSTQVRSGITACQPSPQWSSVLTWLWPTLRSHSRH